MDLNKNKKKNLYKDKTIQTNHKQGSNKWLGPIAGFFAIAAIIGISLTTMSGTTTDQISESEKQALIADFKGASIQLSAIDLNNSEELKKVEQSLKLPPQQRKQLIQQAQSGGVHLGWISVWDNYAEDGDIVQVSANGLQQNIPILNSPVTIVVPFTNNSDLQITGIADGGGGITVAAKTAQGIVKLPPLAVGQIINIPLI